MRTAALVLGIIGGVFGILAGIIAILVGGMGMAFEAQDSGLVTGLGFGAILLGVVGIVGGALANGYPKASTALQLVSGVLGFVAVSAFWLISGPLLIVGAALAFFGRRKG